MSAFPPAFLYPVAEVLTPWADNFVPIIPVDLLLHSIDHPFCWSRRCPCHQDREAVHQLRALYREGLASKEDLKRIYRGQTL